MSGLSLVVLCVVVIAGRVCGDGVWLLFGELLLDEASVDRATDFGDDHRNIVGGSVALRLSGQVKTGVAQRNGLTHGDQ